MQNDDSKQTSNWHLFYQFTFWLCIVSASFTLLYITSSEYNFIDVTLFIDPSGRFQDFSNFMALPNIPNVYWTLPPFSIFFASLWQSFLNITSETTSLIVYSGTWILLIFVCCAFFLKERGQITISSLLVLLLMIASTHSILFTLDRGNQAGFVVSFCLIGLYFYQRGDFIRAAMFFALAANIKITPILYGFLYVVNRKWKELFVFALINFVVFSVSYYFVSNYILPGYSIQAFKNGISFYLDMYAKGDGGLSFGFSLLGLIKNILYLIYGNYGTERLFNTVAGLLFPYSLLGYLSILASAVILVVCRPSLFTLICTITCWILLLPPVMSLYYLPLLYLPLMMILTGPSDRISIWLIFAALLPKGICSIGNKPIADFGGIVTPLFLVALFVLPIARAIVEYRDIKAPSPSPDPLNTQ